MTPILEVKNLTKIFRAGGADFTAVDNISFSVKEGEIVGFLGPNGAGKTTTIQMLLGLTTPTSGNICYFGKEFNKHRAQTLQKINYTSGYGLLPWRMTVWENLDVYTWMYEIPNRKKRIQELAESFEATPFLSKRWQDLSAGQKTRVMLMKSLINNPLLVLYDEPTASLDPDIADKIRTIITKERNKRKMSILITSHNMREVEEMCDRVVFLNQGKIYAIDTPEGLAQRNNQSQLHLMVTDGLKRLIELTEKRNCSYIEKKRFIQITMPESDIAEFLSITGTIGVVYSEIEIVRPSLEDFFLSVSKERVVV